MDHLEFIEAKCAAGMTYELVTDYHAGLAAADGKGDWPGRGRVHEFSGFVQAQAHLLSIHPAQVFQWAANQPDALAPAVVAKNLWDSGSERRPWLQWVNKPQHRDPCLMTLAGHSNLVKACAYSPDGRRIISGSQDATLKVWDAETGAELATLTGHKGSVNACAYSPDGRRIVSGSLDKTLKLWDAETGEELATLTGHENWVQACAYSPDGRRIVSAGGTTLIVWDADTGAKTTTIAGHKDAVWACTYSPDGRRIMSRSSDNTLKVWDAQTGAELATLEGHEGSVQVCAYSPDGRRIVSAGGETLRVWDAQTRAQVALLIVDLSTVALGMGGRSIATGGGSGDSYGIVYILRLMGFGFAAPMVTPVHLYRFDSRQLDAQPSTKCEWCGQGFTPSATVLDAIHGISRNANLSLDQSPCLELPAEAWDELRLLSECPHCHEPLKFNPFIVDNRP